MKISLLACFVCCLVAPYLHAQEREVKGRVTSADDGTALPGTSVTIRGTSLGTITDAGGNYVVKVPDNAILVFSFVGYTTMEVAVQSRKTIDVSLDADMRRQPWLRRKWLRLNKSILCNRWRAKWLG